jgi:hypothetical protein
MHQVPSALLQPEDPGDAQNDYRFAARRRRLRLQSPYLKDVGDIGSLYSGDLLIHTTRTLERAAGLTRSAIRFLFNGAPAVPESPKRICERDVVTSRPESFMRFRIARDEAQRVLEVRAAPRSTEALLRLPHADEVQGPFADRAAVAEFPTPVTPLRLMINVCARWYARLNWSTSPSQRAINITATGAAPNAPRSHSTVAICMCRPCRRFGSSAVMA